MSGRGKFSISLLSMFLFRTLLDFKPIGTAVQRLEWIQKNTKRSCSFFTFTIWDTWHNRCNRLTEIQVKAVQVNQIGILNRGTCCDSAESCSSMDCNVFPGYLPDLYVIRLKSWITIGKGMPSRPNEVAKWAIWFYFFKKKIALPSEMQSYDPLSTSLYRHKWKSNKTKTTTWTNFSFPF